MKKKLVNAQFRQFKGSFLRNHWLKRRGKILFWLAIPRVLKAIQRNMFPRKWNFKMMDQHKYLRQLCTRNKQVSELGKHETLTFKDDETFYLIALRFLEKEILYSFQRYHYFAKFHLKCKDARQCHLNTLFKITNYMLNWSKWLNQVKACGRLCQICDFETRFLEITDWKLLQFAISPVL